MNESLNIVLAVSLIGLGVLAELNLLRVFLSDWLEARGRRKPAREGSRAAAVKPPPTARWFSRGRPALAAGLLTLTPGLVRAAAPERSDPPSDVAATTPLAAPLALSFQPTEPPPAPPAPAPPLTISTNRPSFDDTAGIVQIGHFQLETGYTFTFRNRDGVETQTHNAPELLLRIPLIDDRLELQIGTSGYVWSRNDGSGTGFDSSAGFSDVTVGLRVKIIDQDGGIPRLAFQASTTTGVGTDGISNQDAEPTLKLIWSYDLGDGWGIYGNLAGAYPTSGGNRFLQGQFGVCLTKTLNDQWSLYAEYYVFGPNSKGTDAAHYLDAGAAYLITPTIQLDARVGLGLNQEANNLFAGAGISFLF